MRFERLRIPAFGPFQGLDMRFPSGGPDFHIVYGANEAGKSSLLRAIRDLMFGIPVRSGDVFRHEGKNLRIAAEVVSSGGQRLAFQRRKGQRNTLLDSEGAELPARSLQPFLGSIDETWFSAMFGLGTKELRAGAEELLRGEGVLGNALFSASLGGTAVQEALARLAEESGRLYRGRTVNGVTIRPSLARMKGLLEKTAALAVPPDAWDRNEKELVEVGAAANELALAMESLARQQDWLVRCSDALPTVGRMLDEERRIRELGDIPQLPSDFADRARTAIQSAMDVDREMKRLESAAGQLVSQLQNCPIQPELIERAEELEQLHQDLGTWQLQCRKLPALEAELAAGRMALQEGLQRAGLSGTGELPDALQMDSAVRLGCEESAADCQRIIAERDSLRKELEDLAVRLEEQNQLLAGLSSTELEQLRDAAGEAGAVQALHQGLPAREAAIDLLHSEAASRHLRLADAPADWDAVSRLQVPGKAAIRRFREGFQRLHQEIRTRQDEVDEASHRIVSIRAEIERIVRRHDLPSLEDLQQARDIRDRGWQLVLKSWKGDGEPAGSGGEWPADEPLEQAFPAAIASADAIADRLLNDAATVEQLQEKNRQISRSENLNQEAGKRIGTLKEEVAGLQNEWEELWASTTSRPGTPDEMDEWRDEWQEFCRVLGELRAAEKSLAAEKTRLSEAQRQMAVALGCPDQQQTGFAVLHEKIRRQIQIREQAAGQQLEISRTRENLTIRVRQLKVRLDGLENDCREALGRWDTSRRSAGLPANCTPQTGLALLREREQLRKDHLNWTKLQAERDQINAGIAAFTKDSQRLGRELGIDDTTADGIAKALWRALAAARKNQTLHDQAKLDLEQVESKRVQCAAACEAASRGLEAVRDEAGLEPGQALEPVLAAIEKRQQAVDRLDSLRATLFDLARNESLAGFVDRVCAEDAGTLALRRQELDREVKKRETERLELEGRLVELKTLRKQMESAGSASADCRQEAESVAAGIQQDSSRFVRLQLAIGFLKDQIERFRRENQGPLLERSGHWFQQLTCGSFSGLQPDFQDDDVPVIVGIRNDGQPVPVAGMSDGTRDQLFLALRMAALEHYLSQHEPMPLIMDDLLITFDDGRAGAILKGLHSLAQRTQILLFTHHEHIVGLSRQNLGTAGFRLHVLENGTASTRPSP